jgi:hypothetical protein
MKQWFHFTLILTILMAFTTLPAPLAIAGPPSVPPPSSSKLQRLTGKVTQVNPAANTFTVTAKGQSVTFIAQAPGELTLLKVGQILDITYTQTPGGPMKATSVKSSKSNSSE